MLSAKFASFRRSTQKRFYRFTPVPLPVIEGDPPANIPSATHLLSLIPRPAPDQPLPSRAIIGWFKKPLDLQAQEKFVLDPLNFSENYELEELIQDVLKKYISQSPAQIKKAKMTYDGWMNVIDQRSIISRAVWSEDILGCIELQRGKMIEGTYTPMPTHRLTAPEGIFQLDDFLSDKLLEKIKE